MLAAQVEEALASSTSGCDAEAGTVTVSGAEKVDVPDHTDVTRLDASQHRCVALEGRAQVQALPPSARAENGAAVLAGCADVAVARVRAGVRLVTSRCGGTVAGPWQLEWLVLRWADSCGLTRWHVDVTQCTGTREESVKETQVALCGSVRLLIHGPHLGRTSWRLDRDHLREVNRRVMGWEPLRAVAPLFPASTSESSDASGDTEAVPLVADGASLSTPFRSAEEWSTVCVADQASLLVVPQLDAIHEACSWARCASLLALPPAHASGALHSWRLAEAGFSTLPPRQHLALLLLAFRDLLVRTSLPTDREWARSRRALEAALLRSGRTADVLTTELWQAPLLDEDVLLAARAAICSWLHVSGASGLVTSTAVACPWGGGGGGGADATTDQQNPAFSAAQLAASDVMVAKVLCLPPARVEWDAAVAVTELADAFRHIAAFRDPIMDGARTVVAPVREELDRRLAVGDTFNAALVYATVCSEAVHLSVADERGIAVASALRESGTLADVCASADELVVHLTPALRGTLRRSAEAYDPLDLGSPRECGKLVLAMVSAYLDNTLPDPPRVGLLTSSRTCKAQMTVQGWDEGSGTLNLAARRKGWPDLAVHAHFGGAGQPEAPTRPTLADVAGADVVALGYLGRGVRLACDAEQKIWTQWGCNQEFDLPAALNQPRHGMPALTGTVGRSTVSVPAYISASIPASVATRVAAFYASQFGEVHETLSCAVALRVDDDWVCAEVTHRREHPSEREVVLTAHEPASCDDAHARESVALRALTSIPCFHALLRDLGARRDSHVAADVYEAQEVEIALRTASPCPGCDHCGAFLADGPWHTVQARERPSAVVVRYTQLCI